MTSTKKYKIIFCLFGIFCLSTSAMQDSSMLVLPGPHVCMRQAADMPGGKPRVISFPVLHHGFGALAEEIYKSQHQLYKSLLELLTDDPNIKIVGESLCYDPTEDTKDWFKVGKARFCDPLVGNDEKVYLESHNALELLYAKGILQDHNLVKSVSIAPGSPYREAELLRQQFLQESQFSSDDMIKLRQAMGINREVELISNLAKSLRENPHILHVIICGETHELSRYFNHSNNVFFFIAEKFEEKPRDDFLQPLSSEYKLFFKEQKNPLFF